MAATPSVFLDINLPNATTWFYFSALLAVALFFKFTRLLSMRNWDILSLFLPMPGLLLLLERDGQAFWGYAWLLGASGYFLARCLVDLALVRRPALGANLNLGGLFWLGGALFVSLVAVAVRENNEEAGKGDQPKTPIDAVRREFVEGQAPPDVTETDWRLWIERGLTLLCHLAVAAGMVLIGKRHFDDLVAGTAAATFYLLLPYTYLLMPATPLGVGRWDHAWPAALMVWAVLAYQRPLLAGLFLGLAAGSVLFPALTFPVWLSFYRSRGGLRFTLSFLLSGGLCLGVISAVLWFNGELPHTLLSTWAQPDWFPWKPPQPGTAGFWQSISAHWVYRMPVFLGFLALVLATAFWPHPKNLGHVLALSAAILIGIQFWYADQGGVYVLWYLPFLLLLIFRPNLAACLPPPPADDRLARLGRRVRRRLRRLLGLPEREPVGW